MSYRDAYRGEERRGETTVNTILDNLTKVTGNQVALLDFDLKMFVRIV